MIKTMFFSLLIACVIKGHHGEEIKSATCRDDWNVCHLQQLIGNCETDYVRQHCARSCGVCICKDGHRSCQVWEQQGKCYGNTAESIRTRGLCRMSCRECTCQDYDPLCTTWMNEKKCTDESVYLKCPKSCNQCQCGDNSYDSCTRLKNEGHCFGDGSTAGGQFVLKHCQKSCNQCGVCADNYGDCLSRKQQGKCLVDASDPEFIKMRLHCAKTCGFCGGSAPDPDPKPLPKGCMDDADPAKRATCAKLSKIGACSVQKFRDMCPLSCKVHDCGYCGDTHRDCQKLASMGHCITNFYYMRDNCHLSCGLCEELEDECEDLEDECSQQARYGRCMTDPENMFKTCPYSCNVCKCGDNSASCPVWAVQGQCMSNPAKMLTHCAKSCKVCGVMCEDMTGMESLCYQNKLLGYCETKQREMVQKCPKTCGFCTPSIDPTGGPNPGPTNGPIPGPTDFQLDQN